jgi:hypothetical protein
MSTCDLPSPAMAKPTPAIASPGSHAPSRHQPAVSSAVASGQGALDVLRSRAHQDPAFAAALRITASTQAAAQLAADQGIQITPEALWRNRGTLVSGGLPTWRG